MKPPLINHYLFSLFFLQMLKQTWVITRIVNMFCEVLYLWKKNAKLPKDSVTRNLVCTIQELLNKQTDVRAHMNLCGCLRTTALFMMTCDVDFLQRGTFCIKKIQRDLKTIFLWSPLLNQATLLCVQITTKNIKLI